MSPGLWTARAAGWPRDLQSVEAIEAALASGMVGGALETWDRLAEERKRA